MSLDSFLLWLVGVGEAEVQDAGHWRVEWGNPIELWLIFLVLIPAVASYGLWLYRREQGFLTPIRRGMLYGIRMAAFGILLLMFLQPVLSLDVERSTRGVVVVLLDTSQSMGVKDDRLTTDEIQSISRTTGLEPGRIGSLSRLDLARAWLARPGLANFANEAEIVWFAFSGQAERVERIDSLAAAGTSTRLGDSLLQAVKELRGRTIHAIVVVTDGRSNAGVTVPYAARALGMGSRKIPVFAIGVGSDRPPRDLRVVRLSAEPVVLLKDDVLFEFEVEQTGLEGFRAALELFDGTKVVDRKEIDLKGERTRASLKAKATTPGEFRFTVRAEPLAGEISAENNQQSQSVLVLDKRVRVLYVEGRPRSEYIFLKGALIRDDKLHAYCYLHEADPGFRQEVSLDLARKGDPGLRRFPGDRKDLEPFDVIVWGDVDLVKLGRPKHAGDSPQDWRKIAENLVWFVEELGGALIFLGGHEWNPWGYRGTPLEKLLPVLPPASNAVQNRIFSAPFHPRLTPQGREDPAIRLKEDRDENQRYWESEDGLPALYWYTPVKEAKPGARVLLKHPDGSILCATQLYGRGRTLYWGTDETWRWREYTRDQVYYKLWGTLLQRMRVGRLSRSKRYNLFLGENFSPGDRVQVEAQVFDENLAPASAPVVEAELETPSGEKSSLPLKAVPGKPGYFQGVVEAGREGQYKVKLGPKGRPEDWTVETFSVKTPALEFESVALDRALLESLCSQTGGMYFPLTRADELAHHRPEFKRNTFRETRERELWDSPLALLGFLLLLSTEWALRKKWGLS